MSTRASSPRRWVGLCFAVAALLAEQRVEAEPNAALSSVETQSVVVSYSRCEADAFAITAFLDSLRVELAGRGLHCCALGEPGDETSSKASLRVNIAQLGACGTELERVRITVQSPDGLRALDSEISLSDVQPSARPRALALAVAELMRLLGRELRDEPAKPPPKAPKLAVSAPQQPQTKEKAREATRAAPVDYAMHVEADVRYFPAWDTHLWGGRARLTASRHSFHADGDLGANTTDARVELGDVVLRSASVGVGVGPRLVTRFTIIDLGLRAEWGWAWVHGKSAVPDVRTGTGSGMISSAALRLSVEGPTEVKLRPGLALESGVMLRGINGDVNGRTATGLAGYYLLAAVGIGVSL